ncbi:MAG: vitamin K epoxide reductase family protein [Candidatus Magasanikbacteria bacterium]
MYLVTSFLVLCFLGIIDSGYLLYKRKKKHPLVCPLNTDCTAVLGSKYNTFLGVHNEIWGGLFYLTLLAMMMSIILGLFRDYFMAMLLPMISLGFLYSLYLTGVQIFKIKEYCLYCLFSAFIAFLILLVSLGLAEAVYS